jgi:hypothetical protein
MIDKETMVGLQLARKRCGASATQAAVMVASKAMMAIS